MLVLGIAVLVAAFYINSDIANCKSLLAQKCLRGLFIMGTTMVAIPITSFIVCSNIEEVGSKFKGTLLVWFTFLIGGTITALASIINYECKNEKSKTFYPIIIGVMITLTCLMYFFSSKSTKTKPTVQQKISPFPNRKVQP